MDHSNHSLGVSVPESWASLTRWGMCWRVTLTSAGVGMLGVLIIGFMGLFNSNSPNIFFGPAGVFFGLLPALMFGGLSALLGLWLTQFHSVLQAVLFGLIGVGVSAAVLLILDGIDSVLNPCPPTMGCFAPFTAGLAVMLYAGFPLAIMASVGLGLAIFITNDTSRTKKRFIVILAVTALVFTTAQVLGLLRPTQASSFEDNPGPVCGMTMNGKLVEVPCGPPSWPYQPNE